MNLTSEFAKRKNDRQSSFRQKLYVSKDKVWPNTKFIILEYIFISSEQQIRVVRREYLWFQIIRRLTFLHSCLLLCT
jgi:hypothetical protein